MEQLESTQRRQMILRILNSEGKVFVTSLARHLGTSVVTIRKDLDALAAQSLLQRSHGGATRCSSILLDLTLQEKNLQHDAEKSRIAAKAASLVQGGDTIFLDSGSTTSRLIPHLAGLGSITLITNALNIAVRAAEMRNLQLILVGGQFHPKSLAFIGPLAEGTLSQLTVEKCFMGVDALDLAKGITTPVLEERGIHRTMLDCSQEVIVLADSSKFGKRSLGVIAGLNRIHRIITDSGTSKSYVNALKRRGIKVLVV
ncbi:MAG: DeoR/GlpR family DNA-binding transcription regulator [Acidobacteria bacterium]|nr:DeoR/GlpR family DNA-binding transcription regulator [Acidobacteriota bacterium]MCI0625048.1 DeoR/GlpR family DNA-binding transcription regulator [Acidobacteriota bacterium]MCI0724375.1 DeoR/GlpR family DNA-binding transcription regulator [Acidobacteriota bacterium]